MNYKIIAETVTPITQLETVDTFGNNLFIKREDMIPFSFGGNKVRIAWSFVSDMLSKGKNCMIGFGNNRSNLCRALANICSGMNIPCHVISFDESDGSRIETPNSKMVDFCGAVYHHCAREDAPDVIDNLMTDLKGQGYDPYYIYGDKNDMGNEKAPMPAYIFGYNQIVAQEKELGVHFDYIFLPVGSCTTISGLLTGRELAGGDEQIVGISISRAQARGEMFIRRYVSTYLGKDPVGDIIYTDKYLLGGYGQYNDEVLDTIKTAFIKYGIPFDHTYSGKAFTGMKHYIEDNNISGKNILFIHTGGAPLFFDILSKQF